MKLELWFQGMIRMPRMPWVGKNLAESRFRLSHANCKGVIPETSPGFRRLFFESHEAALLREQSWPLIGHFSPGSSVKRDLDLGRGAWAAHRDRTVGNLGECAVDENRPNLHAGRERKMDRDRGYRS
jgi:hypothetical protein